MRTHHLKTWPKAYWDVKSGLKTWEFRRNDRAFETGDKLYLQYHDPSPESESYFDNDNPDIYCNVTYVMTGGLFGIPADFCIMSIEVKETCDE